MQLTLTMAVVRAIKAAHPIPNVAEATLDILSEPFEANE